MQEGVEGGAPLPGDFRLIVCLTTPQMNDFGDLLGTPYAPVSKIAPVKSNAISGSLFPILRQFLMSKHKVQFEIIHLTIFKNFLQELMQKENQILLLTYLHQLISMKRSQILPHF